MIDTISHLKSLVSLPGLSGHESAVRVKIEEAWRPLTDDISVSRVGSLYGLKRGSGAEPRPRILLAAHMDAIGLMVTRITAGMISFTEVGGVDPRILPGQKVTVHGRKDLPGIVVQPSGRLLPSSIGDKPVPMEYLLVDVGLEPKDVEEQVRPGDLISFAQAPFELTGETVGGHTMDNRASVAALTVCLDELRSRVHTWDVWTVATVQEEETFAGAITAGYELHPDMAVAIDVTFARGPGATDYKTYNLGKGPTICWGPNIHPGLHKSLKDTADRVEIPYQQEFLPRHSGTDAFALQVVGEGIPCVVVGIPLRYMHTPVEVVSVKDIQRAGRLLAEWISHLEPDFITKLSWDKES